MRCFLKLSSYPLPNQAGTGALGITNNYAASGLSRISNHQADAKVDWRPSDNDNVSGRWSIGRYDRLGSQCACCAPCPDDRRTIRTDDERCGELDTHILAAAG